MRKEWLWIGVAAVLLSACTAPTTEQQAPQQPYNGPVVEIGGVELNMNPITLITCRIIRLMAILTAS